jgi:hypothetical protein
MPGIMANALEAHAEESVSLRGSLSLRISGEVSLVFSKALSDTYLAGRDTPIGGEG